MLENAWAWGSAAQGSQVRRQKVVHTIVNLGYYLGYLPVKKREKPDNILLHLHDHSNTKTHFLTTISSLETLAQEKLSTNPKAKNHSILKSAYFSMAAQTPMTINRPP